MIVLNQSSPLIKISFRGSVEAVLTACAFVSVAEDVKSDANKVCCSELENLLSELAFTEQDFGSRKRIKRRYRAQGMTLGTTLDGGNARR